MPRLTGGEPRCKHCGHKVDVWGKVLDVRIMYTEVIGMTCFHCDRPCEIEGCSICAFINGEKDEGASP